MSEYIISRFTLVEPLPRGQVALFNTMSQALGVMPAELWAGISVGDVNGEPLAVELSDQGFLVEKGMDETAVLTHFRSSQVYDTSHLKYFLSLTGQKVWPELSGAGIGNNRAMVMKTARAVLAFILDDIEKKRPLDLELAFIGREDGLNPAILQYLSEGVSRFCRGRGLPLAIGLNTGGQVLLTEVIRDLVPFGLVTIKAIIGAPPGVFDGDSSLGDRSYYERLLDNLASAADAAPLEIMGFYGPFGDNYKKFTEILDELAARGLKERVLKVSYGSNRPLSSPRDEVRPGPGLADCQLLDNPERLLWLRRLTQDRGFAWPQDPPQSRCPVNRRDSLFIDERGAIMACPALKGRPEYECGRAGRGVDFRCEARFLNRKLKEECLTLCQVAPLCDGGCRWSALVCHGDFSGLYCPKDVLEALVRFHLRQKILTP